MTLETRKRLAKLFKERGELDHPYVKEFEEKKPIEVKVIKKRSGK